MINVLSKNWPLILGCLVVSTAAIFVLLFVVVPRIVSELPADYFLQEDQPFGNIFVFCAKNFLGGMLLIAGPIVMTPLFWFPPGSGFVLMVVGIMLMEFPGRRKLLLRFLKLPKIPDLLNEIRRRRGESPFLLDAPDSQDK